MPLLQNYNQSIFNGFSERYPHVIYVHSCFVQYHTHFIYIYLFGIFSTWLRKKIFTITVKLYNAQSMQIEAKILWMK